MSMAYTYEIVEVNESARCMEVVYSAPGYQTMHIGMRLPFENETLDVVIRQYAPVAYWLEQTKAVLVPKVGLAGSINPEAIVAQDVSQKESTDFGLPPIFPTAATSSIPVALFK